MVLPTRANGTDAWRGQARNCVLCCVYSMLDLHLSCSEVIPQSTQEDLGQRGARQEGRGSLASLLLPDLGISTFWVPLSRKLPCSEAPGTRLVSQKETAQNRGSPGSQWFLQQLVA